MPKRCFSELVRLKTFDERFAYLKLKGSVGKSIFSLDRYLNQVFYKSNEWLRVRDQVILRDRGCDLGVPGLEISSKLLVHHMNPITIEDLDPEINLEILNPEFLITTVHSTHQAIHYGDKNLLLLNSKSRKPGDTKLW